MRKVQIWWDLDYTTLSTLINQLPRHHHEPQPFTRHATVYSVKIDPETHRAEAITSFIIFKTNPDGGITELFAVGKYFDTFTLNGSPRFLSREVRLDTRMLGIGTHYPL